MNKIKCIMLLTSSLALLSILCVIFFNYNGEIGMDLSKFVDKDIFKYNGETGMDLSKLYEKTVDKGTFINNISPLNSLNDNIGIAPILIINLDKDVERLHHLLSECKEENLYAIKGGNCCQRDLNTNENSRFIYSKKAGRSLMAGERKCFLSHEMCWKKAANQKLPSLIVEDDISFPRDSARILKQIVDSIRYITSTGGPTAITVRLGSTRSQITGKASEFTQLGNTCLGTGDFAWGAWAYIVTPDAAKTLLRISEMNNLSWPVDYVVNPSSDRNLYEERIPPQNEYMFLEALPTVLKPINSRYSLPRDKTRTIIIQELSTSLGSSRSWTN